MRSRSAMGMTGAEAVHGEDDFSLRVHGADGDGGAEDGVLAGVVDVLREQHDHQLAVAAERRGLRPRRSIATFMLASRSLRLASTSSISDPTPTGSA